MPVGLAAGVLLGLKTPLWRHGAAKPAVTRPQPKAGPSAPDPGFTVVAAADRKEAFPAAPGVLSILEV